MSMASMAWAYIRPREAFAGRIGQGLTDQTLKNIHAVVGRYPWGGCIVKRQSIKQFAHLT
jgi:hypothetical protein